jgi:hypothetical protein
LEAYAAHCIFVTHPPLFAIHLLPAIHVLLHVLFTIDLDVLPAIHLQRAKNIMEMLSRNTWASCLDKALEN